MKTELRIPAGDVHLAATLHHDEHATGDDRVVVVNSAMGMRRDFYDVFATYLAAQGIDTLCWDYRGVGDSVSGSLRETDAHIHDWGERDLPAVIEWMRERYPSKRLAIVAHSVGGQIIGMAPEAMHADKLVLVASQSGYWKLWSGWQQLRIGFIWHVVIPLVSRIRGHFPSRWFGLGVDLPNNVARQWARWGRDPHYLMGRHRRPSAANYATLQMPLLNVWISDDDIASYAANRRMASWYAGANITNWNISPADFDTDRIGHFRLFRETIGPRFWPRLVEWLRQ